MQGMIWIWPTNEPDSIGGVHRQSSLGQYLLIRTQADPSHWKTQPAREPDPDPLPEPEPLPLEPEPLPELPEPSLPLDPDPELPEPEEPLPELPEPLEPLPEEPEPNDPDPLDPLPQQAAQPLTSSFLPMVSPQIQSHHNPQAR